LPRRLGTYFSPTLGLDAPTTTTRHAPAERAGTISKPEVSKSTVDCFVCRSARVTVLMIIVAATVASGDQQPLTSDEIAIYQAFLKDYDNGSTVIVNLASIITPLELTENDRKTCLNGSCPEASCASGTLGSWPTGAVRSCSPCASRCWPQLPNRNRSSASQSGIFRDHSGPAHSAEARWRL
jgi:hypothetical protein